EAINHQSSSTPQHQSPVGEITVAPLSFSQTGVYIDCINNPEDTQYNIPWVFGFPADMDAERLRKAALTVLEAHKHIFVRFEADGDDIVQRYAPVDIDIPILSLSDVQLAEHKKAFVRPFDLAKDVLCRMEIAKTESGVFLLLDIHHLVFDGSSLDLFIIQLCDVLEGKGVEKETYTHLNHAADEQKDSVEAHKAYYDNLLGACEGATELPADLTTPHECEKSSELYRPIDLDAIERFCREHPVTPAHLTLAATLLTFARFTGNDDLYISTVSSGRSNIRIQNTFGMFVNTLPFAAKLGGGSVMDFIKDVSKRFAEAMRHEQYPFARIAADYGYTPELAFAYQLGMVTRYMQNGHEVSVESLEAGAPKFKLIVRLEIHNGQPSIVSEYDNGQYSESLVSQLTESIANVLKTFINQPQTPLADVSLLSAEQVQLLDSFNQNEVPYDDTQTVVSLFRRQAKETPDNVAVVYKDTRLTYRDIDELSDRIASYIASKGLGTEDVVSVLIPRCELMPIASLGVIKAGCAYQPLDPTYPKERLNFMMQDADAKLLIADEELRPIVDEYQGDVLLTKDIKNIEIADHRQAEVSPDDLFILLYTSGSTGTPKGCQLTHRNLVAFIHWYHRYFDLKETDKVTAYASYGFDANMFDTYPALTRGAAVYIIPEELRLDLIALNEYFEHEHITNAFMTTQVAYQFATTIENHSLKHFTTGGEKLASLEPTKGYKLHNAYGPTETTILETCYQVDQKMKNIPIGKAIDNMHLYVVDSQGHRLPAGAVGELWASGPQVGRGYLNRPEKTAEVFIENPFSKEAKYARIYRTGDIVRYLEDGSIQFVGRSDGQVKIRGFRIELKEVEAVIRDFPGIKDATVQAFDEQGGGKFIAAYIVSDEQIDIEALNSFILDQKPPYMVPAVTMQIDSIPLNQNQKVNKKALPKPEKKASQAETVNAPLNVLEEELHELIASIINNTDFGITTILGYAGLTSISAIKLAVQVNKRYGVTLDSKSLVKSGTLQGIENEILTHCLSGDAQSKTPEVKPSHNIASPVPLSYPQQGIYVECMKNPMAIVYNVPFSLTFPAGVSADELTKAVAEVVRLHPLLACHFELQGNETVQVWNKDHEALVGRQKMSDAEYEQHKHEFVMPFRLNEGPLYRLEVVETDTALHLLADFHHLIFDGASFDIFFSQVAARLNGESIEAEQFTYADYVKSTEENPEAKDFFNKVLANCEDATEIPADLQGTKNQSHTGEAAFPIDMERIEQFCHTQGITPANLLLGAVYYTISRYAATRDVYMSTISNGRSDVRLSDTVGMFVNTLALHGHIGEGMVKDFLKTVSTDFDETMRHEQYPFARVAADYGFYSKINFVYQMGVINEYKIGETPLDIETMELDIPKFKACVLISPHQGQPSVVVQYDDSFYSQQMMAGLAESIAAVANHFIDTPDASLRSISIMSERQRQMVAPMHEEGRGDIPVLFLHQGMEQQAAQHPDRLALVASDATFTYAEFNSAANRIANALIQRGVKPRDRVAMLLPRTSRVMLSMYGILKTGAAFIPCDPHYPADRIQLILDDSDARYIITDAEHANLVPADKMLDVEELLNCQLSTLNCQPDITPDDLAYLIYTSGSTGRPKGVMLHHRGICNELTAHPVNKRNYIAKNEGHAALGLTSLSFDGSFVEHGLALFNGLTFVLVHDDYVNDPLEVTRLMDDNHVDIICSAQSRLVSFMASDGFMEALRRCIIVMCGGEKFPDGLMRRLQEQTPQAHIFNCYGPTETTVESNCHELTHEEQVTVGRPLLNMQECIVDQDLNELPVGVMGELLIGGVQVAHGYNKLPDKTDAAFITWQGQRFYRSGDFARWDEKGRVHILGRTDNQVKLRGQRIELGEIESVMMKVEGVNNVTVLIRKLNGKDHLCAYFVADREIPIDQMKAQISKSLTTYMVPTAYLQLPEMPVTPNGKINTKVLPEPQMVAVGDYVAPQNDTEQTFCDIFAEVLQIERVGATDNFFDLGGTSLNVTRVIIEADKHEVHVAYGDVFTNPTPRQLAALISGSDASSSEGGDATADRNFDYAPLDALLKQNTLDAFREGNLQKIGNVLLTGSTGFLGIHILKELIERNDVPVIWCMVRAESEEKAQNRLKTMLYFYFANNYKELFGTRIRVVLGDVTKDFTSLPTLISDFSVDTVFNCAAVVKHFSSGTDIEDVNIGGAVNCMNFCLKTGARLIHTSTYSIGGMSVEGRLPADTVLSERDLYFGPYLDNQYIHSKFVSERTVLDGIVNHGLKAKIMRLGNLAPRSTDGEFQINFQTNSSMGRIRVFKMLGCYPYDISDDAMEFSPINEVAQAIVLLSQTPDSCCVFHPYNNHPVLFGDVLAGLAKVGGAPVQVETEEFARKMDEAKADSVRAKLLQSLMAYQDMAHGQQVTTIEPVNQYTSQVLYRLGFKWSATSWDYIERFLIAINGFGYFDVE
ncbi:MAG: amino acid adenylation domain-containing protein, partial [Muribaculaceae bacterium]|nr:amino acid adenylation domain-containing protein [Muribaculaceae bacterium]